MADRNWKCSIRNPPEIGETVLVKTFSGQVFYAVYFEKNGWDVHRIEVNRNIQYRQAWYQYSSRTVVQWRYFKDA